MTARRPPELGLLFDLLRASEGLGAMLRTALESSGLTPTGYAVTSLVDALGSTTPSEVAELIGAKPSTLSAHLAKLVREGILSRTPGADGRSVDLRLTDEGRRVHVAAVRAVRQVWRPVSKDLDVEQARAVLAEMIGALEAGAASSDRLTRKGPRTRNGR
jgi:DNA-binding MarR family transcriptional regulator